MFFKFFSIEHIAEVIRLKCIVSGFAFVLFFGLVGIFVIPSLIIYALYYPFVKHPEDKFQYLSSVIYRIFYKLLPQVKLEVEIQDNLPVSAVYISTHQSNLDYPILGSFINRYIIMTKLNFKNIPLIATVGHLIGIRYLNKNNLDNIANVYAEFDKTLKENRNLLFFAEGTRGDGKTLQKFKKGAFRLAYDANKPIVPIIICNTAKILPKGSFCFHTLKHTTIKVKMLTPIYPDKFANQNDMLKFSYSMMEEEFYDV